MNDKKEAFEKAPIPRAIMIFAVPTIISQIITIIYNLADTFWVGHTNDPNQVAALTLSFPIYMFLTAVANLFGIGANSLISRSLGAGDFKKAKQTSAFSLYMACLTTLVMVLIIYLNMNPLLRMIGASDATIGYTRGYLIWVEVIGGIPTVASLMMGHMLRGIGETKMASYGMIFGGILNMILDPVFIFVLGMNVPGAALATCLSNCASLIFFLIVLKRSHTEAVDIRPSNFVLRGDIAKEVLLVGFPAAFVIFISSGANVVLTHFASAYGDTAVAAFGVTQKAGTVAAHITVGLSQGIMPLVGYNFASGAHDRVKETIRVASIILISFGICCTILLEIFPSQFVKLFISEAQTVEIGTKFIQRWVLSLPGMCTMNLYSSIFQAMGKWKQSLFLNVTRQGFLLIPLLCIMNTVMGMYGLVWAQPISDCISMCIAFTLYQTQKKSLFNQN